MATVQHVVSNVLITILILTPEGESENNSCKDAMEIRYQKIELAPIEHTLIYKPCSFILRQVNINSDHEMT